MMRNILIFLSCIFIIAINQSAASENSTKIGADGYFWKSFSALSDNTEETVKIIFIRGIYEGIILGHSEQTNQFYTKISYNNVVKAIDQFYEDYRNNNIFIVDALKIISLEIQGADQSIIDDKLKSLRKFTSEFKEKFGTN